MSRVLPLALFLAGCCGIPTPLGPPAPSGRYTCSSGATFIIDAGGVFDNGDDMSCSTGLAGPVMTLECHGYRRDVSFVLLPNGDVETDVIDRLYGEVEPTRQRCSRGPL